MIIGSFSDVTTSKKTCEKTYHNIINEAVQAYGYPLLFDISSGHIPDNRALVLGEKTIINVGEFISCVIFGE